VRFYITVVHKQGLGSWAMRYRPKQIRNMLGSRPETGLSLRLPNLRHFMWKLVRHCQQYIALIKG